MKLDGTVILYLLVQKFESVEGHAVSKVKPVDYPILYDVSSDMSGHTVLVPEHERIHDASSMVDTLCVCLGDASAQSARNAGLSVIYVEADVLFQHLYNYLQGVFVHFERLDARLRACVDTYAGFQSLVEACTSSTGIPCALIDEGYRIVCQAWTDETDEQDTSLNG